MRKRMLSIWLSACMVLTLLPVSAMAAEPGTPLGAGGKIVAFAKLDETVSAQTVPAGTAEDELNLPGELTATVTESGDDTATDSGASKEIQATVTVSGWESEPAFDGSKSGEYLFTPTLALPEGLTAAEGVAPPQISVTVKNGTMAKRGAMAAAGPTSSGVDILFDFEANTIPIPDDSGNTPSATVTQTADGETISIASTGGRFVIGEESPILGSEYSAFSGNVMAFDLIGSPDSTIVRVSLQSGNTFDLNTFGIFDSYIDTHVPNPIMLISSSGAMYNISEQITYISDYGEAAIDVSGEPGFDNITYFDFYANGSNMWLALDDIYLTNITAPSSDTPYDLWVGNTQVTSANKGGITGTGITGTVTYDPGTKTLTLNNATINESHTVTAGQSKTGIYAADDLTIVLVGSNSVTAAASTDPGYKSCAVWVQGELTISGAGSLTATGGTVNTGASYGIMADVALQKKCENFSFKTRKLRA